jgi:FkbM family methyltransferase
MATPIIIVSFNNYKYVKNTVSHLTRINKEYLKHTRILDNCSTCPDTVNYLKNVGLEVIYNKTNEGPWICPWKNVELYNSLPDKFILTDADLGFNENLPQNFVEQMVTLSNKYNSYKIGFALDISDADKMFPYYIPDYTVGEWEKQFWEKRIENDDYELYNATIDTTFSLVSKTNTSGPQIRIAGNFTAKHLPWYVSNPILNMHENYKMQQKTTNISTISNAIRRYIEENYIRITKNEELFLIKRDRSNLSFWENVFSNWESETFAVFDKFLQKDKIFIDIGGWVGTTCMYGSRKSREVFCVEADTVSFECLKANCSTNCVENYTLINNAIYNVDDVDVNFGRNSYRSDSLINDSTSHIQQASDDTYQIRTITIDSIVRKYGINLSDVSLIKVDIEGGEEYILEDLYKIYKEYKVPLYIGFHLIWWKNKDLDRFTFLTQNQKQEIIANPFASLLFQ